MRNFILLVISLPTCLLFGQPNYSLPDIPPNLIAPSNSNLTLPRISQSASIKQTIGITEIQIDYHRPGIYGRSLFEGTNSLAPYGQVWRAGANENTTITFSNPVKVNGELIEAGTYGLFFIPNEDEWMLILSKSNADWGAFFYDEANDIHRSTIVPEKTPDYHHWLKYEFINPLPNSVDLTMNFGNVKVSIPIEMDVNTTVIESLRKELRGVSMRNSVAYNQAAEFCLINNVNLEEALGWSQRASRNDRSFTNLMTEAGIYLELGDEQKSEQLKKEAFEGAAAGDLVNYGFSIMGRKLDRNRDRGLEAFQKAIEIDPKRAFPMFAMGQFHETKPDRTKKDIKEAIRYYEMARDNTQIDGLKRSMNQRIELLEKELN